MKKFDLLVLKAYLGPFLATFSVFEFLFLLQNIWVYIDELIGKGLGYFVVAELMYYTAFLLVPMTLPITVLLASIMSIGTLTEHNELTAVKSAGVSFSRVLRPLFLVSIGMGIIAFLFSNFVYPWAYLKQKSLLRSIVQTKMAINIQEKQFFTDIENLTIRVEKKIPQEGNKDLVEEIAIFRQDQKGNTNVTLAEHGSVGLSDDKNYYEFELFNGSTYQELYSKRNLKGFESFPHYALQFDRQIYRIDLRPLQFQKKDMSQWGDQIPMMSLAQLKEYRDTLDIQREQSEKILLQRVAASFPTNLQQAKKALSPKTYQHIPEKYYPAVLSESEKKTVDRYWKSELIILKSKIAQAVDMRKQDKLRWIKSMAFTHKKFTLALACVVLFLAGAPIGAAIKKGGVGFPVVYAIFLFIVFYSLETFGFKSTQKGEMHYLVGIWLPIYFFLPVAAFFMYQTITDKKILSKELFLRWFRKT